jgi:hypothetical protein
MTSNKLPIKAEAALPAPVPTSHNDSAVTTVLSEDNSHLAQLKRCLVQDLHTNELRGGLLTVAGTG